MRINNKSFNHTVSFFIIVLSFVSCEVKRVTEDNHSTHHVYDAADFLSPIEEDLLNNYLDSVERKTGWYFVYSAINNFEKENFDSLASKEFKHFPLSENGALLFLSRSDATVKILVGKQIHSVVTNAELSEITEEVISDFRLRKFYQGLRTGVDRITVLAMRADKLNVVNK